MIDEKIDPVEFAIGNFQDESVGEAIAKEIEKAKKKMNDWVRLLVKCKGKCSACSKENTFRPVCPLVKE